MKPKPAHSLIILVALLSLGTGYAGQIDKKQWAEAIENEVPRGECKEGGYLQSCFNLSVAKCETEMKDFAKNCISRNDQNIPPKLELPGKDQKWTDVIISCMYNEFRSKFEKQVVDEQHCKEGLGLLK